MKCLNLHCHSIEVYYNNFKQKVSLPNRKCASGINKNTSGLFGIYCKYCNKIYEDYNSNYQINKSYYSQKNVSLFCNEQFKSSYIEDGFTCFEFVIFNDYFLIGKKDEIISYICQKFETLKNENLSLKNKIKQLDKTNENNEKSIKDMRRDLINVRREKNSLNYNLEREKSKTSQLNSKIEKLNSEAQNLNDKLENLNTNLNSKENENKKLKTKLDKISFETNENVKKVLIQVENEKLINKNLESKISNLEKKEKQQNLKNLELVESNKEKEKLIQNLRNDNKNLGANINELKKDINIKDNTIKNVNDLLSKEKNINMNKTQDLNKEKEKNKKLNDKLDNIASNHSENISKILQQLDEEKEKAQNLLKKNTELEEQEKIKYKENKELESQLKQKDEELKNVIKNYIPENYGLKFQSDCKTGEYDIILDINSIMSLIKEGWNVIYNQKEGKNLYLNKKKEKTIVVGVIGNKNMGKTFFLEKLCRYDIPKGFNVKTIGLSVRYGTTVKHNVAILDSAGQETPLLKMEKSNQVLKNEEKDEDEDEDELFENEEKNESKQKNEELEEVKDKEFEQYSRDKLITEYFLQKFIIYKSDIIILVVGNISLTEQKLLYTVKQDVKNLDKNKMIFVIHNLKEYSTKEQVDDYIENTLKKLCKIDLDENPLLDLLGEDNYDDEEYYNQYFIEQNDNVAHFIFVNEFSEIAKYYNTPIIRFIQKRIEGVDRRNKFAIIEDCKEFLVKIAEEIMEEKIKIENLITEEGEKYDKILLKDTKEINLKKYAVNEVGRTFRNDSDEPNYSCFIDKEANKLFIRIELPGGVKNLKKYFEVSGSFNIFTFEGEKPGDDKLEKDEKSEIKKLHKISNGRKRIKFKIHVQVACGLIQIIPEDIKQPHKAGKFIDEGKGIITAEYNIVNTDQKRDKNDDETYDF